MSNFCVDYYHFTLYFIDYRCLTPKIMTPQIHTNRTDTCLFYWIEETCHRNQVLPPLPPQVILRVRNIQSQKTIYTIYTIYTFLLKCQNMEKHRVLSTNILKIHQRYGWNRFSRIPEFIYHNLGQFSRILAFSRIPDARRVPALGKIPNFKFPKISKKPYTITLCVIQISKNSKKFKILT